MFAAAPSILLAAAIAAGQPVPTKRAPDPAQKRAAVAWVKDGIAWTHELTAHGEKLGGMLPAVLEGKQNGDAMRAEIKRTKDALDAKLEYFKGRPSPPFAEMNAFRTVFLDYLTWENRILITLMSDLLKIAEDKKMPLAKKQEALMKTLLSTDAEEKVWKAKIESSMTAVETVAGR